MRIRDWSSDVCSSDLKMTKVMTRIAICTAAPLPMSYSAIAQDSPEAITVTGEYGEAPDSVRTLSQAVSYADLDLSKEAARDMLRHRVSLTARFLCDKLGETNTSSPIVDRKSTRLNSSH